MMKHKSYVYSEKRIMIAEAVPFKVNGDFCCSDFAFPQSLERAKEWAKQNSGRVATMPDIAHLRVTDLRAFFQSFDTTTGHYLYGDGEQKTRIVYHGLIQPLFEDVDLDPKFNFATGGLSEETRQKSALWAIRNSYIGELWSNGYKINQNKAAKKQLRSLEQRCISFEELMKNGSPKEDNWGVLLNQEQVKIEYREGPTGEPVSDIDALKTSPRVIATLGPENTEKYLDAYERLFDITYPKVCKSPSINHAFLVSAGVYDCLFERTRRVFSTPFKMSNCFVGIREIPIDSTYEVREQTQFKIPSPEEITESVSQFIPSATQGEVKKIVNKKFNHFPKN